MDRASLILLQRIDCNCNNCVFMYRDSKTYQKWYDFHYKLELAAFKKAKEKAIKDALAVEDPANRAGMLRVAQAMKFQFEKLYLLQYGNCARLGKPVSFIPNVCQLETQNCFVHRQDFKTL